MAYIEIKCYGIKCDACGSVAFEYEEHIGFECKSYATEEAENLDWTHCSEDDKHYCPGCSITTQEQTEKI